MALRFTTAGHESSKELVLRELVQEPSVMYLLSLNLFRSSLDGSPLSGKETWKRY